MVVVCVSGERERGLIRDRKGETEAAEQGEWFADDGDGRADDEIQREDTDVCAWTGQDQAGCDKNGGVELDRDSGGTEVVWVDWFGRSVGRGTGTCVSDERERGRERQTGWTCMKIEAYVKLKAGKLDFHYFVYDIQTEARFFRWLSNDGDVNDDAGLYSKKSLQHCVMSNPNDF